MNIMTSDWSVPETEVIASVHDLLDDGQRGVLTTVIDIEGSAYRRPGAKMLITDDQDGVGSLTAGCLEDEIRELARDVLETGTPRIETYDLTGDDDVWGLGVGCNGVITVLLEPVDETYRPAIRAYERGQPLSLVTIIEGDGVQQWSRAQYAPDDSALSVERGTFPDWLTEATRDVAESALEKEKAGTTEVCTDEESATLFVDPITPPPEIVVFGNGHDVKPVVQLAKQCGFRVTVMSFRGGTDAEEFPAADMVDSSSPAKITEDIEFDENTYAIVMSHNFVDDRLTVDELLNTSVPYIGLMGPRERFEEMLDDFGDEGKTFTDGELDRLYTPVGLNLGGGSPYQIALSIVAEALAVHKEREPEHLTDREGPIHSRGSLTLPDETA